MAFSRTLYWLALCILPLSVCAGNGETCNRLYAAAKYREAMACYMQPDIITHPAVMNRIGFMYDFGQGVPANPEKAADWYRRSAETGFVDAQANLGIMYETGTGVTKDYQKAMFYYRKAAEHGNTRACASIGILYDKGDGVPIDHNRAVQYYIMGAMAGHAHAQALLAVNYLVGDGVPKDKRRAAYWFEQAANNGYPVAMQQMVKIYTYGRYGYDRDPEKAEYWQNRYNQTIDEQCKTGSRSVEPPLPFPLPSLTD